VHNHLYPRTHFISEPSLPNVLLLESSVECNTYINDAFLCTDDALLFIDDALLFIHDALLFIDDT